MFTFRMFRIKTSTALASLVCIITRYKQHYYFQLGVINLDLAHEQGQVCVTTQPPPV